MSEGYHKRSYVVNNIDNAVDNGWIVPFYQPVVWSDSKELCGCEALARWKDPVYGQLYPNGFIPVLEEYHVPRELIHVEVTESALTDNLSKLNEAINRIKELGYSLWLDDFGSGYSSLNVLKDYQFDVVKIDMRFLSSIENSEKAKILVDCIVQMADRINMLTLTEGVETESQAEFLNSIGCTRLQGYLFGRPVPKDEFYSRIDKGELVVSDKVH